MGRSGGSGNGGGNSSGGFSGGGRVSGGFSGGGSGGRSGGRSGSGPSWNAAPRGGGGPRWGGPPPGGGFGGWRPGPLMGWGGFNVGPVINVGGRGNRRGNGSGGSNGCLGTLIGLLLVCVLLSVVMGAMDTCSGSGSRRYDEAGYSTSQASGTVREKLDAGAVTKTGWYTDEDGDWIHDASKLTPGLERFFDETGVQPYVYILKNGSETSVDALNARSAELYGQLFSDEGHFLLVFCDDGNGSYNCGYTIGTRARTVMDDEAVGILANELNNAYNNADSDEEVFSEAFSRTAASIMSAAQGKQRSETAAKVGVAVVAVALVGGGVYLIARKRKAGEEERRKRAEEILNTPLEKFGEDGDDVEKRAEKYEEKDKP